MKEYIERAQLLKNLGYDETRRADVLPGSTFDIVLKEPAADVAEVRHGRWEEIRDSYGNLEGWLCECGREVKSKDNYCPSCGVRMDKEDKHEVKCAKCGEIKEIICTVDGKPWCEDCLDRAMGWPLHLTKSSEAQNERNPFQSQAAK